MPQRRVMKSKSSKVTGKRKLSGRRGFKDLASRASLDIKGGDANTTTTTSTGKAAGNVSGGWNLVNNKVHS